MNGNPLTNNPLFALNEFLMETSPKSNLANLDFIDHFPTHETKSKKKLCEELLNLICDLDEDRLFEYFSSNCGNEDLSIEVLKKTFNTQELSTLIVFVNCYSISMGFIPLDNDYHHMKDWLGIEYALDLLNIDDWMEKKPEFKDFFDELSGKNQETQHDPFKNIKHLLMKKIKKELNQEDNLISHFENIDLEYLKKKEVLSKEYTSILETTLSEKMNWFFFISICYLLSSTPGNISLNKSEKWPEKIIQHPSFNLIKLIEGVIADIRNMNQKSSEQKSSIHQPFINLPIIHSSFQKMDIPKEVVNWMPNAGNSCYFSSTVQPLYVLRREEIERSIGSWSENYQSLFLKLHPDSKLFATPDEINSVRKEVLPFYSERYRNFGQLGQEDAQDNLRHLTTDVLKLPSFSSSIEQPKFYLRHQYKLLGELERNAESYDIEGAKCGACTSHIPVIQIELNHQSELNYYNIKSKQFLSELITKERETNSIDRSIYLKEETNQQNLPKYITLKASHTEQFFVKSRESAPEYFIGCLARFHQNENGYQQKRFDPIVPDFTLEFSTLDEEGRKVKYDLMAITNHKGDTLEFGHYYSYIRVDEEEERTFFKYDDLEGVRRCSDDEVMEDVILNASIFYYKKQGLKRRNENGEIELKNTNENNQSIKRSKSKEIDENPPLNSSFTLDPTHSFSKDRISEEQNQKKEMGFNEAFDWASDHLAKNFKVDFNSYHSLGEYFLKVEGKKKPELAQGLQNVLNLDVAAILPIAANILERTIYLVDPHQDKEIYIDDEGQPIPMIEQFRAGEDFSEPSILYIYRTKQGSYIPLIKE